MRMALAYIYICIHLSLYICPPASLDKGIAVQSVCVGVGMYVVGVMNIGCFGGAGVAPGLAVEPTLHFRNNDHLFKNGSAFQQIFGWADTRRQNTTTNYLRLNFWGVPEEKAGIWRNSKFREIPDRPPDDQ